MFIFYVENENIHEVRFFKLSNGEEMKPEKIEIGIDSSWAYHIMGTNGFLSKQEANEAGLSEAFNKIAKPLASMDFKSVAIGGRK